MKLVTLCGRGIRPGVAFAAIIVSDTEDLFAVDERFPADPTDLEHPEADWRVTHIPTMYMVWRSGFTDATTMDRAMEIARAFYREAKALGWDLKSEDPQDITRPYTAMSQADKERFWERVTALPLAGSAAIAKAQGR